MLEIRLEKGIQGILEETKVGLQAARRCLDSGALGTSIVSDEFNHDVLTRMDELGYALELMRDMGSLLSPSTQDKVERLDRDLREFLPKAEKQFAENKDPIYIVRPMFPESFWWRFQILHPEIQ